MLDADRDGALARRRHEVDRVAGLFEGLERPDQLFAP